MDMERERYRPDRCRDLDLDCDGDLDLDPEVALHRLVCSNSIGGGRSEGASYCKKKERKKENLIPANNETIKVLTCTTES